MSLFLAEGLVKRFGGLLATDHVDIAVEAGEIVVHARGESGSMMSSPAGSSSAAVYAPACSATTDCVLAIPWAYA